MEIGRTLIIISVIGGTTGGNIKIHIAVER